MRTLLAFLLLTAVAYGQSLERNNYNNWARAVNAQADDDAKELAAEKAADARAVEKMTPEQRKAHFDRRHLNQTIAEARYARRFKEGLFLGSNLTPEMKSHNDKAKKLRPKNREFLTENEAKRLSRQ